MMLRARDGLMNVAVNFSKPIVVFFLFICIAVMADSLSAQINQSIYQHQYKWPGRSVLTDDWQRQHPVESGWSLRSVSVVDSIHAWASGWHDSAAGLVVRTTDGGETWSEVSRTFPLFINDIHFVTDSLGWIVGGNNNQFSGFALRTTDRGLTWTSQLTDISNRFFSVFFLDPARGWVCGDSGKILATTNAGDDWQTQYRGRRTMGLGDIFVFPNGIGWCGGSGVFKTTNFGLQWDSISNIVLNQFSFLNDSSGWAVTTLGTFAGFNWKTTNGGRNWAEGLRLGDVYPTDVAMLSDTLVISTMWDSRVDPPLDYYPISMRNLTTMLPPIETRAGILWGIGFARTGHGFAVGSDEIVSSSDSGRTWINRMGPQYTSLLSLDMVDDSVGWVVGEKELIMKTTDGGRSWKTQTPAIAGELYALSAIDRDHAFAGGAVFMSTTNGGTTWARTTIPSAYLMITGLSFLDTRQGWAATESNNVLHTTDGGSSWTQQQVPSTSARLYGIDFVDSSYGWCVGTSGIIYATTNGGDIWTIQYNGFDLFRSIDFVDRGYGWAAGSDFILRTTNGGADWDTSDVSINAGYRAVHFVNRDTGWAVGEGWEFWQGRIVATTNGGDTWIVQRPGGSPGDRGLYSIDAVTSHLVWISGDLGEILHTTNGGGITSVAAVHTEIPTRFELEQNYPNPFNPSTTISYSIPQRTYVVLKVHDVLGKKVATLVDEFVEAGYHQVPFHTSNLASGVYFYRLATGSYSNTKKMLILR
jgi:photosystem II stability/assembly factor-like uncharacterized protein